MLGLAATLWADEPDEIDAETAELYADAIAPPEQASTGYGVQLGSFSSDTLANKAWQTIQGKFAELLGQKDSKITPRLGAGGSMSHRLVTGPYANANDARAACEALKQRQQDCFIVSPY